VPAQPKRSKRSQQRRRPEPTRRRSAAETKYTRIRDTPT
jgi:hypothetical protein